MSKSEKQCLDCDSPVISGWVDRGDGRCSHCHGEGYTTTPGDVLSATFANVHGGTMCSICHGTGQCQTCGGTGYEYYYEESSYTPPSSDDSYESTSDDTYESSGSSGYSSSSSNSFLSQFTIYSPIILIAWGIGGCMGCSRGCSNYASHMGDDRYFWEPFKHIGEGFTSGGIVGLDIVFVIAILVNIKSLNKYWHWLLLIILACILWHFT